MKCCVVVLTVFSSVALGQVDIKTKNQDDDGRWIWGLTYANYKSNKAEDRNNGERSPSTIFPPYDDPCLHFDPIKPNFSAPGRTISDEKCEEYNWDKLLQEEYTKRSGECSDKKNRGKPLRFDEVGGRPTYAGEFPHMGAIGWKAIGEGYLFLCGGTLISSKFILTAAHCSKVSSANTGFADTVPKIVRLNDKNLFHSNNAGSYFSKDVDILRIIVHPDFKPPKKYYDIALMELAQKVEFTWLMQPACLWNKGDFTELGDEATSTGWGVLRPGSLDISPELQVTVLDLINLTYCDKLLYSSWNRNWQGLREHQLCAGKLAGGVDACQGDSGGPLQVKKFISGSSKEVVYHIIGVTSFGIGCALPNVPGIYTRVSSFIPWIESHVWPQG